MPDKTISVNRKAGFDYHLLKRLEAGIALTGTEIKSVRDGSVSIREAYVRPKDGELWLIGAHIAKYAPAAQRNHDPTRDRKLLLHKREIYELEREATTSGATIVPLRLYLKNGKAKLEIALARGKKQYDKRESIAKRDADRRIQQALRRRA
ncbi:MAG: SsrA-binding protein SmpB [Dehalococcoidia bacterium]